MDSRSIIFTRCYCSNIHLCQDIYYRDKIHNPLNRSHSELRSGKVNLKEGDPFTIALFGVDSDAERKHQGGGERSDTIMILSINPKEKNRTR